jgi:hypothetical protein
MTGWAALTAELGIWADNGQTAVLWWRDDDAITATPQLSDLLRLAGSVPLALAVIPAFAQPDLAEALTGRPQLAVLQHGWLHVNRGGTGSKKSEYPPGRAAAAVIAEISAGRSRLDALFGPLALPVFVPPWNRIADEFLTLLPNHRIAAVSGMASQRAHPPSARLARLDVDLDLVDWRGGRGFVGEDAALGGLIDCLQARRGALRSVVRPIGLLTHHLIMDRATAGFVMRLIGLVGGHRAGHWAAVGDLL